MTRIRETGTPSFPKCLALTGGRTRNRVVGQTRSGPPAPYMLFLRMTKTWEAVEVRVSVALHSCAHSSLPFCLGGLNSLARRREGKTKSLLQSQLPAMMFQSCLNMRRGGKSDRPAQYPSLSLFLLLYKECRSKVMGCHFVCLQSKVWLTSPTLLSSCAHAVPPLWKRWNLIWCSTAINVHKCQVGQ